MNEMGKYYATIKISEQVYDMDDQLRAHNLYWKTLFPLTTKTKGKRNPARLTLLDVLRQRVDKAKKEMLASLC